MNFKDNVFENSHLKITSPKGVELSTLKKKDFDSSKNHSPLEAKDFDSSEKHFPLEAEVSDSSNKHSD
jgi:hypothetical protein